MFVFQSSTSDGSMNISDGIHPNTTTSIKYGFLRRRFGPPTFSSITCECLPFIWCPNTDRLSAKRDAGRLMMLSGDEDEDKLWPGRTVLSAETERIRWRDGDMDK